LAIKLPVNEFQRYSPRSLSEAEQRATGLYTSSLRCGKIQGFLWLVPQNCMESNKKRSRNTLFIRVEKEKRQIPSDEE
jgi:hypothetical protein